MHVKLGYISLAPFFALMNMINFQVLLLKLIAIVRIVLLVCFHLITLIMILNMQIAQITLII